MPVSTRASGSAPASRIYTSVETPKQVHFKPRRKRVTARHSLGGSKLSRQETLTQNGFVKSRIIDDNDIDEEISQYEEEERLRKRKRRKTEGDAPDSSSSKYSTQSLTQMPHGLIPTLKNDHFSGGDSEDELDSISGSMEPVQTGGRYTRKRFGSVDVGKDTNREESRTRIDDSMGPPRTPIMRRYYEVPSSQSPVTPLSTQSRSVIDSQSPLKEVSSNMKLRLQDRSPRRIMESPTKLPKLEIEDTFERDNESLRTEASSPPKRSSPPRMVRFASATVMPVSSAQITQFDLSTCNIETAEHASPSAKNGKRAEISDSDADSDEETQSCYEDFGPDTQMQANILASSSDRKTVIDSSSPDNTDEESYTLPPPVSQFGESQRLSTQHFDNMQPISDRSDIIISIYPNHVKNIVNRTKNHEFRSWKIPDHVKRIWIYETSPVSAIKYMASIGDAKSPEEMMDLKGIGNQEFKNGEKISRYAYEILELYELADPVSLATAKANSWLGGPPQKYVYVRPAVLGELMANLKPPMFKNHHTHSPGPDSDSQEAEAQLQSTFLQFTQFQHPIGNSRIISSPIGSSDTKFNQALDLLSTQQDSYRSAPALPRMSQATTVDLTQPPNLHTQQLLNTTTAVSEPDYISGTQQSLILESSPAHVPSSMPKFPPLRDEGQNVLPDEIPLPFSLASSQLLTYTQMLPASLMNDNVPPPPSFIEDSDMED